MRISMTNYHRNSHNQDSRRQRRKKQQQKAILTLLMAGMLFLVILFAGGQLLRSVLGERPTPQLATAGGQGMDTEHSADGESSGKSFSESQSVIDSGEATGETGGTSSSQEDTQGASSTSSINLDLTGLYSHNALLTDASTGQVLGDNRGTERMYPASMTKIMTAYLAVEYISNLDDSMAVPYDIFDALYAEDASLAGFAPGEIASFRNLLYGVLLPSGAECCQSLARWISGSEEAFVELMNERARSLGMTDTHFCNSTGLHDANHYTTCADLALLLREALKNQNFREAFTSERRSVPPTAEHPEGFTFHSTMFRYMDSASVTGGEILGGKTGFTDEAGQCLASLASVNGQEYILVTAGADGDHTTAQYHILDAVNVYSRLGEETAS